MPKIPPLPADEQPESNGRPVRLTLIPNQGASEESHDLNRKALSAPSVRLALGCNEMTAPGGGFVGRAITPPSSPSVRLALPMEHQNNTVARKAARALAPQEAPTVRLAHITGAQGDNNLLGRNGVERLPETLAPALLISFFYLDPFLKNQHRYCYRDWVMDSGAFSAHASGKEIDLDAFIDKSLELSASDPTLTEIFALDVIGDWKASLKNTEKMWSKGVRAIPCFHYGEPWDVLMGLARDYPKIAIGGCVGKRDKDAFAAQCFARVWPKKIHGFGFGAEKSIMRLPFHSCDATNWEMGPVAFGRWAAFGGASLSVRGSNQNLRAEVEFYLELERKARLKWKKEMAILAAQNDDESPAVREKLGVDLPDDSSTPVQEPREIGPPPTVRLVVGTGRSVKDAGFQALGPQPPKD